MLALWNSIKTSTSAGLNSPYADSAIIAQRSFAEFNTTQNALNAIASEMDRRQMHLGNGILGDMLHSVGVKLGICERRYTVEDLMVAIDLTDIESMRQILLNNDEIVNQTFEFEADFNETPLAFACRKNNLIAVRLLLALGATVDDSDIQRAMKAKNADLIVLLIKQDYINHCDHLAGYDIDTSIHPILGDEKFLDLVKVLLSPFDKVMPEREYPYHYREYLFSYAINLHTDPRRMEILIKVMDHLAVRPEDFAILTKIFQRVSTANEKLFKLVFAKAGYDVKLIRLDEKRVMAELKRVYSWQETIDLVLALVFETVKNSLLLNELLRLVGGMSHRESIESFVTNIHRIKDVLAIIYKLYKICYNKIIDEQFRQLSNAEVFAIVRAILLYASDMSYSGQPISDIHWESFTDYIEHDSAAYPSVRLALQKIRDSEGFRTQVNRALTWQLDLNRETAIHIQPELEQDDLADRMGNLRIG